MRDPCDDLDRRHNGPRLRANVAYAGCAALEERRKERRCAAKRTQASPSNAMTAPFIETRAVHHRDEEQFAQEFVREMGRGMPSREQRDDEALLELSRHSDELGVLSGDWSDTLGTERRASWS